jgi:TolB-like protein
VRPLAPLGVAVALWGCAASALPPPPAVGAAARLPRVALIPLENLSGRSEATDRLSRVFLGALGETGQCQTIEPGDVEAVFTVLRIRDATGLTRDRVPEVAAKLDARYLLAGTILEYGMTRSPDGDVPTVGVSLRLIDGRDARVVWTAMRVRAGDDRETLFGWGRVRSLDQLGERIAREVFDGFRLPVEGDTAATGGGGR